MKSAERRRKQRITREFRQLLGGKCVVCGTTEQLECDHILGGGRKERKEIFGDDRMAMFLYYLKHPDEAKEELQLLCSRHHMDKTWGEFSESVPSCIKCGSIHTRRAGMPGGKQRYFCNDCNRSFMKTEHYEKAIRM